jgi:hypothetical protein
MTKNTSHWVRETYDRLAEVYTRQSKPIDRELLNRFGTDVQGRGDLCDMGCAPGHISRFCGMPA